MFSSDEADNSYFGFREKAPKLIARFIVPVPLPRPPRSHSFSALQGKRKQCPLKVLSCKSRSSQIVRVL